MSARVPELESAVHAALTPAWAEVLRAKTALHALLADGATHGIRTLQACLLDADGIPRPDS
jgi:hypothetical protein